MKVIATAPPPTATTPNEPPTPQLLAGVPASVPASVASLTEAGHGESRVEVNSETTRFLLELGRALHTYGGSSPQIEEDLRRVAEHLGVHADVSSTPTGLFQAIGSGASQHTYFQRLDPGHVNGEKQLLLSRLRDRVFTGLTPSEGLAEVRSIVARPRRYGGLTQVLAGALASTGGATLMGGHAIEVILAGLLGLAVSALVRAMATQPRLAAVSEPVCGCIAGAVAAGSASFAARHGLAISPSLVSFAGILTLVPGLPIMLGIRELTARHLSAGTARLTGAATSLLLLCVGVAIGVRAGTFGEPIQTPHVASALFPTEFAMTAITAIALLAFFNCRPRDFLPIWFAVVIGFYGGRLGDPLLGVGLGAGFGALLVTVYSHALARLRQTPSAMTLLPGLILLLPSSFGFRSFEALLHGDVSTGIEAAFSMVITALSLVTGLLLGAAAIPENSTPPPQVPNDRFSTPPWQSAIHP